MNKLSQWWDKLPLSIKLAQVLLPSVAIGTVCIMILLNFTLHASFLNSNNDVTGWGSLLIGSAIGIYITFAILFYSDASQKKISDIIAKQESNFKSRQKFAIKKMHLDLQLLKRKLIDMNKIYSTETQIPSSNKDSYEQEVKVVEASMTVQISDMYQFVYVLEDVIPLDIVEDALKIYEPLRKYYSF